MAFAVDSLPPARLMALSGDLTVRGIEAAYALVSDALAEHDAIAIDCSNAAAMDVTLVQLLLSARRSAKAAGKRVAMAQPASGRLLELLTAGGFLDDLINTATSDHGFWLGSEDSAS